MVNTGSDVTDNQTEGDVIAGSFDEHNSVT